MARKSTVKRFANRYGTKLYAGISLLVVALVMLVAELTGFIHLLHKNTSVSPVIPTSETSGSAPSSSSGSSPAKTPSTKGSDSPVSAGSTTKSYLPLYAPYGDFVSNHHPNLSGSPAPSGETSVCNTTPGATCYIRFTKGASTTSLPSKTTDSNGAAYWTWDVKTAHLTAGDWIISAVANLNGQTKSTIDQTPLSVAK